MKAFVVLLLALLCTTAYSFLIPAVQCHVQRGKGPQMSASEDPETRRTTTPHSDSLHETPREAHDREYRERHLDHRDRDDWRYNRNRHYDGGMLGPLMDPRRGMRSLQKFADSMMDLAFNPREWMRGFGDFYDMTPWEGDERDVGGNDIMLRGAPDLQWRDTDNGFVLTALTPGLKKEELKVYIESRRDGRLFLHIGGESKHEYGKPSDKEGDKLEESKHPRVYQKYRFEERIPLPTGADRDSLKAKYEDGMLVVSVDYHPDSKPADRKQIDIQ